MKTATVTIAYQTATLANRILMLEDEGIRYRLSDLLVVVNDTREGGNSGDDEYMLRYEESRSFVLAALVLAADKYINSVYGMYWVMRHTLGIVRDIETMRFTREIENLQKAKLS